MALPASSPSTGKGDPLFSLSLRERVGVRVTSLPNHPNHPNPQNHSSDNSLLTNPHPSHIIERMSDSMHTTEQTTERKPPTLADIVREKTGDGALIIDFFTDVMTGRIEGAELCHRIDAAKQLVKYGSKDAAEFLAKYKGVPCGHSINGRPNPADPCTAADRSLVAVTLNAPPTLTRDFLTVLSGIDEFLMARLIRAQTADAGTIIDFLDDVMQDRIDGFKTHHRIAAAKELIVHIVRDEQPAPTPREPEPSSTVIPAKSLPRTRYGAGIQEGGVARPSKAGVHPDPNSPVVPAHTTVIPAKAGIQEGGVARPSKAGAHPEPNSPVVPAHTIVVPAEAGTQGGGGGRSTAANSARTKPVLSTPEGPAHPEPSSTVVPAKSLPRTRYGAGTQGGSGGRNTAANSARTEPVLSTVEGPALPSLPQQTTQNPRTTLAQPDPWAGPIDSTNRGRSPPVTATGHTNE